MTEPDVKQILSNTKQIIEDVNYYKKQLGEHQRRLNEVEDQVSGNAKYPGLTERVRTLERDFARALNFIKWIGSGGLAGVMAVLVLLYKIAASLAE